MNKKKIGSIIMTIALILFLIGWAILSFVSGDAETGFILFTVFGSGWVIIFIFIAGFFMWLKDVLFSNSVIKK